MRGAYYKNASNIFSLTRAGDPTNMGADTSGAHKILELSLNKPLSIYGYNVIPQSF